MDKDKVEERETVDVGEPLDGSFANLDVSLEETVETTPSFTCEICQKNFKWKHNLKKHLKKHDGSNPFYCSRCNQFFQSEEDINVHNKNKHENRLLCITCGKTFKSRSILNSHMKLHDSEDSSSNKVPTCPFENCRKAFQRITKYQDHLNTHTGITPYTCDTCKRSFKGRYKRNEHQAVCSGKSSKKCETCSQDFTDGSVLKRHIDAGHLKNVYKCECGKIYSYPSSLYKHRKQNNHYYHT